MPYLILVAGGSGSGKTTVVSKIINNINKEITVISMDDYYKENDNIPLNERKNINYDHPDAIDMSLLKNHLLKLINGEMINCPIYDFKNHNRSKQTKVINPTNIIILEGILSLYDNDIRDLSNLNIFIKTDTDLRFIRRLKRDIELRGRSVDDIINQYIKTVKPMYEEYVEKTIKYADIIISNDDSCDIAIDVITNKLNNIE